MGMNWLITGGCGFIGSALAGRLLAEEHNVRIVDNLSVGGADDLPKTVELMHKGLIDLNKEWPRFSLVVGDVTHCHVAIATSVGADVIIHLAANTGVIPSIEDPVADCQTNVFGVLNFLEGARAQGVKRFVLASSGAPLGNHEPPLHEGLVARPISPYGASKLAGEAYCCAYWGSFGVETVALRFGNVYGPGSKRKSSVVAKFIKTLIAGCPLNIYGDGCQTRDFIYIDDILEAIIRSAKLPNLEGEVLQIATQKEHSINEITEIIKDLYEQETAQMVELKYKPMRRGEVKRNYSDISKAKALLDFSPRTSLHVGILKTMQYFLELNKEREFV